LKVKTLYYIWAKLAKDINGMADNYLERKYEEYLERKAAAEKARRAAWKKRMDDYRKRLAEASRESSATDEAQHSR